MNRTGLVCGGVGGRREEGRGRREEGRGRRGEGGGRGGGERELW